MNTPNILVPFIELIYKVNLSEFEEKNQKFYEKAIHLSSTIKSNNDWRCDTFSTLNTEYNFLEDPLFTDLIEACKSSVLDFSIQYGMTPTAIDCIDGWVNVAKPGAYQEYHIHPNSHFSLSYYIATPEDCGQIVFKSHSSDTDMFSLPINSLTQASFKTYSIAPKPTDLVVFRSNLLHMVEQNKSNEDRVSISMNFRFR